MAGRVAYPSGHRCLTTAALFRAVHEPARCSGAACGGCSVRLSGAPVRRSASRSPLSSSWVVVVAAWLAGFILQGLIRAKIFGNPFFVPLMPMTSAAFIIFTLYMIPDPATTPLSPVRQAAFGLCIALVYAVFQILHLVFGLFFALLTVCAIRGLSLHLYALWRQLGPAVASEQGNMARGQP